VLLSWHSYNGVRGLRDDQGIHDKQEASVSPCRTPDICQHVWPALRSSCHSLPVINPDIPCAARGQGEAAAQRREDTALPASMDDDRLWHGWSEFEVGTSRATERLITC